MPLNRRNKSTLGFTLISLAALIIRLVGIQWGLPHTINADEPHLVNLAVSFGGGSLHPYSFKYPTLWPYMLFVSYGFYFVAWSCLGLRHSLREFAGLYAWHPGGFFLIGRLLAAALSLLAVFILWKGEKKDEKPSSIPWAALTLLFCPVLVEVAHSAKPDCAMFFFVCVGWYFSLEVLRTGKRHAHWLAGLGFGLAMATQYTALPAALALPLAHFASRKKAPWCYLAEGILCSFGGLFIGSPYIFLDYPLFRENIVDTHGLTELKVWSRTAMFFRVLQNMWNFSGVDSIAGLAAIAGAWRLSKQDWRKGLVLAGPVLAYIPMISNYADGGWPRYLLGAFPALALLAAEGLEQAEELGKPWLTATLAVLAIGPGMVQSARMDREMRLPDTRVEAAGWIFQNIPQGSSILLDLSHASPDLPMTRDEASELAERTRAAGSPRSRLYQAMVDFHPGGGYRVYRIMHTARELGSAPHHVALSQADTLTVDVTSGLQAARAEHIAYIITSSFGATPERMPELKGYFEELHRQGRLLKAFPSPPGERTGPELEIYAL